MKSLVPVLGLSRPRRRCRRLPLPNPAEYPLARAASELGFTYNYIGFENAAIVSRPGLSSWSVPASSWRRSTTGSSRSTVSPRMVNGELYVPDSLVAEMRRLPANIRPTPAAQQRQIVVVSQPTARGAVSLDVRQLLGSYSLAISGQSAAVGSGHAHAHRNLLAGAPRRADQPQRGRFRC